jgi:hypothetical protein
MFKIKQKSVEEYETNLRLFLKLILLQEYSPKDIAIDFPNRSAIVTLNSNRDLEEILSKYSEMTNYKYPEFLIWRYQPNPQTLSLVQQGMINPMQQPFQ